MAESSTVTPTQPQTDKALDIKDPSTIDDVASFDYNVENNFTIKSFKTSTQDTQNINIPAFFPNDTAQTLAPSTVPFILQLSGSGFNVGKQSVNPFLIYLTIGDFIAVVPPLSTSTNLSVGNAFGYAVKSDTSVWVYFNRILFQNIWFKSVTKTFDGEENPLKVQIESGTGTYPFLSGIPAMTMYMAPNNGSVSFQPNFLSQAAFKKVSIAITQTPFVLTMFGAKKGSTVFPFIIPQDNNVVRSLTLIGHNLTSKNVLMVKTSSKLLSINPSALPSSVLTADQSSTTIQNMDAQTLAHLEYFKVGNFLEQLQSFGPLQQSAYNFFTSNGFVENSGPEGHLPADNLPAIKFNISKLPTDNYYVVIYDNNGVYTRAPDSVVFNASSGGMQVHDISPTTAVLQNPTFTINGFNFPTPDDITNGATLSVIITSATTLIDNATNTFGPVVPIASTAVLTINKSSTTNDVNNNGTIKLSSTQIVAKFASLNYIPGSNDSTTIYLQIQTTYPTQNPAIGKISDTEISSPITLQAAPVIQFLTNADKSPNVSKSLVRVDQTTGQVIANGVATSDLYIVGRNFGDGTNISVSIKGNAQHVNEIKPWTLDTSLSAIRVTVDPSNMKGDATIEVKVGNISSEPYIFSPSPSLKLLNTKINAKGTFSNGKQTITTPIFQPVLPYNHSDGYHSLLNSQNTKVSSSIPLQLANLDSKQTISLDGKLSIDTATSISFLPNQIIIPDNTALNTDGTINVVFYFYNIYNVNLSTPKIVALYHNGAPIKGSFNPSEIMTVIGTGFVNGMRYNINKIGWHPVDKLRTFEIDTITHQAFDVVVPDSNGITHSTIQVSNDQAQSVSSANTAGKQNGPYKVSTIVVNDRYSPLLQINQRLPAGIKMYAKGPQVTMTDKIDANMSIYSQMTPFLGSFKTLLVVIRIIVCIIDVICALINPFQLIVAIIALMDCIIDLLSLFPQLAIPIMILSFLQNFVGFLQTFIVQIESYVFGIVNAELALVRAQLAKDFAALEAAEQQAFSFTKQIRDVIAFLEPALQIIQIFKDLLNFAMHFPCASNQGKKQGNGECPPSNMQDLIDSAGNTNFVEAQLNKFGQLHNKYPSNTSDTLGTMFCQAVAMQTATLQTMPGFNGLDSFGNPLPNGALQPGSTSVVPTVTPILPNVSGAIECMNNLTDQIENALNAGRVFVITEEQGQELIAAYTQCAQNLLDQTIQAIGDVCVLAVSALNSELKVSPKGSIAPDLTDDFIKAKLALPSTEPNNAQDAGLTLDLATLTDVSKIPATINTNTTSGTTEATLNFGLQQDIYTPVIVQTTNKSGQRQSIDTIYFNAENPDVGDLISVGDILEIVGGVFGGLQFPILSVQKIFTAVRLTTKLDITFEQKLLVGEQTIPENLSGFDVKVIAHLAGNDAVAVVPADDISFATLQILARDHHGHEIGQGLANKVSVNIESGSAEFVPAIPSSTTDVTGVIQEQGTHYIVNVKSNCAGTVIMSSSVCGVEFVDIGYHANDPTHAITTRKKTVKIIFTPPIPKPIPGGFKPNDTVQVPGTHFVN